MYLITKVIVRSSDKSRAVAVERNEIVCSKEELITKILPKLKRLCEACNLSYRRTNNDKRIQYQVIKVADRGIDDYIKGIDKAIIGTIQEHNREIVNANFIIKRANKKYSKRLDDGIKPVVVVTDYLKPYLMEQSYDLIDDVIHVKES